MTTATTTCDDKSHSHDHHDEIIALLSSAMQDIKHTTITPTSQVIDLLLDIRNLTEEWDAFVNGMPLGGCNDDN